MSDPLNRLVELTVFAPVGLAAMARERLPDVVDAGRTRVEQRLTLARFIGEMVVTQGRRELDRRLRTEPASTPARSASVEVPTAPDSATVAVEAPSPDQLPIEGYESLAAAQVVARLTDLDDEGRAVIERFERAHRGRRTILNRIAQLR